MLRRRICLAAIVVVVGAVSGAGVLLRAPGARGQENTTKEWEYLIVAGGNVSLESGAPGRQKQKEFSLEAVTVERNLDRLGAQGWELVTVGGSPGNPTFFLKRPKGK